MGIVNVTPDSFSDGGRFLAPSGRSRTPASWRRRGRPARRRRRVDPPGAREVSAEEELERVAPVVAGLEDVDAAISIDTSKAAVAGAALDAGAEIVNDVTALRADPALAGLCAERECGVVLMHMQGTPRTMQENPTYDDVVDDVRHSWPSGSSSRWGRASPRSAYGSILGSDSARRGPNGWFCCVVVFVRWCSCTCAELRAPCRRTRRTRDVVDEVKRVPRRADRVRDRGGGRRGADLGRPGDRLRQDGRPQSRAPAPARRAAGARAAGRRRDVAQALHRRAHRPRGRTTASAARSPRNVLAVRAGADVLRVHDVAEVRQAVLVAGAILERRTGGGAHGRRPRPSR